MPSRFMFASLFAVFAAFYAPASATPPHSLGRRALPPTGQLIMGCTVPGVIAPAFDDGPWIYSEDILDRMQAAGIKATWFLNGQNRGNIYDFNSTVQRMVSLGHQVGSHTWSHADLATLTPDGIRSQMTQLETAFTNILGYFPYYMRPPYLSYNQQVLDVMYELGYVVIYGDLNTKDWEYQTATGIQTAKDLFVSGLDVGGTIIEAHDQEPYTHGELIDFMIATIQNRSLTTVTVAECLGQPNPADWYRTSRPAIPTGTTITAPVPTVQTSTNGKCGIINNIQYNCPIGKCCSKWGNCGTTADYCVPPNCQAAYGRCDPPPPPGSITPDGTCGNTGNGKNNGWRCKPGFCCSRYGSCGTTAEYCGVGCQGTFGGCGSSSP